MKYNIILVDDDEMAVEEIKDFLENQSFSVLNYDNGQDAFNEILKRENTEQFDFLITGYTLPQIDGLELVKKLKENYIDIPTAVISPNMNMDLIMEFKYLEVLEIFSKPFELKVLTRLIYNQLLKELNSCLSKV